MLPPQKHSLCGTIQSPSAPPVTWNWKNKYYAMDLLVWQPEILDCLRERQANNLILSTLHCKQNTSQAHQSSLLEAFQYGFFSFAQKNRICVHNPSFYQLYTHIISVHTHTLLNIYSQCHFVTWCLTIFFVSHSIINSIKTLVTNRYYFLL